MKKLIIGTSVIVAIVIAVKTIKKYIEQLANGSYVEINTEDILSAVKRQQAKERALSRAYRGVHI